MNGWTNEKRFAVKWIEGQSEMLAEMSGKIFAWAEPGLREYRSAALLVDYLRAQGFGVEEGVAGMPTAFVARWGEGRPEIGLFAEYDATPGHSQRAVPREEPDVPNGPGFTDAHNMLGVASCIVAAALKVAAEEFDIGLGIRLLGTPAEKLCVGKPYMARDGYFDGMDAVLAWHPGGPTTVLGEVWPLAYRSVLFNFHVAGARGGESGDVSYPGALDAAILTYNNVNMLKEHTAALMRHGGSMNEFLMTGGQATVATPSFAQLVYCWRTGNLEDQEAVADMVSRCAEAAGIVTGCRVSPRLLTAVRTGLPNRAMTDLIMGNLRMIGPPRHTEDDKEFAREVQRNLGLEPMDEPYNEAIIEPEHAYDRFHPADDVNEFTWHAPTARLYVSKSLAPVPGFRYPRWVDSAICGTGATLRMGETAAKVLVSSALELVRSPAILKRAQAELDARKQAHREDPLLPPDLKPPVNLRWPEYITTERGRQWWIPPIED